MSRPQYLPVRHPYGDGCGNEHGPSAFAGHLFSSDGGPGAQSGHSIELPTMPKIAHPGIRDDDPSFSSSYKLFIRAGRGAEQAYPALRRGEPGAEGEHVTVVAIARMVPSPRKAIDALARRASPGSSSIAHDVRSTRRPSSKASRPRGACHVDESPPRCSVASASQPSSPRRLPLAQTPIIQ